MPELVGFRSRDVIRRIQRNIDVMPGTLKSNPAGLDNRDLPSVYITSLFDT